MDSRIKAFIEKKHQERIKESIDKVLADINNPSQKKPLCDDLFDSTSYEADIDMRFEPVEQDDVSEIFLLGCQ